MGVLLIVKAGVRFLLKNDGCCNGRVIQRLCCMIKEKYEMEIEQIPFLFPRFKHNNLPGNCCICYTAVLRRCMERDIFPITK